MLSDSPISVNRYLGHDFTQAIPSWKVPLETLLTTDQNPTLSLESVGAPVRSFRYEPERLWQ